MDSVTSQHPDPSPSTGCATRRPDRWSPVAVSCSSPLLASVLCLATAALAAGCSAPDPRSCSVLCGAASECPDGLTCGGDGYCYRASETPGSCTQDPPDASTAVDGAILPVDASPSDPDALPSDPDADPCAGVVSLSGVNDTPITIPDNNTVGVDSVIRIEDSCGVQVTTVQIRVDIRHPFRGDLDAFVSSPNGDAITFLQTSSDPTDDVHETFDMPFIVGQAAAGDWTLNVADLAVALSGTLDRWSIGINEPAP